MLALELILVPSPPYPPTYLTLPLKGKKYTKQSLCKKSKEGQENNNDNNNVKNNIDAGTDRNNNHVTPSHCALVRIVDQITKCGEVHAHAHRHHTSRIIE